MMSVLAYAARPAVRQLSATLRVPPVPAESGTAGADHDFATLPVLSATRLPLQKKSAVGSTADPHEREADQAAQQVLNGQERPRIGPFQGEREVAPPSVSRVLNMPGRALGPGVRADMERGFGHDFSRVRVHADASAHQSAQEVGANAYTVGANVVFGAGRFAPGTNEGRRLLAHELTHVVQQGNTPSQPGSPVPIQREQPADSNAEEPAKAEQSDAPSSALRKELFKLFSEFEKTVVGDEKFDGIITQKAWDDTKADEAAATVKYEAKKKDYQANLEKFKRGDIKVKPTPPIPVAKFTTCITTEAKVLKDALDRTGLVIKKAGKKPRFDFATEGQKNAQKLGSNIWHDARAGMTERPKIGDILVLGKRGEKVDKAATELNYIKGVAPANIAKKTAANDRAQAAADAAQAAEIAAEEALTALEEAQTKHTDKSYINARGKLTAAAAQLKILKKKAADAALELKKAEDAVPQATAKLNKARAEVKHGALFEFSHVGYLHKIDPVKNKDGTENWLTFDGGQTVLSRESKQGAESVRRRYDPVTNEISGEKSQGGDARWLQGWVDIDKLVEGST
jgi:hypothetical protein